MLYTVRQLTRVRGRSRWSMSMRRRGGRCVIIKRLLLTLRVTTTSAATWWKRETEGVVLETLCMYAMQCHVHIIKFVCKHTHIHKYIHTHYINTHTNYTNTYTQTLVYYGFMLYIHASAPCTIRVIYPSAAEPDLTSVTVT